MAQLLKLKTSGATQFIDTGTQNVLYTANITSVGYNELSVRNISISSSQNLAWEVFLFSKDTFNTASVDTDTCIGRIAFDAADGVQFGGAGNYFYSSMESTFNSGGNVGVPYMDEDNSKELHIGLVNRTATVKQSGTYSPVAITFLVEGVR